MLEIQIIAWNRHKNVAVLIQVKWDPNVTRFMISYYDTWLCMLWNICEVFLMYNVTESCT
jgi:hypothetical protein